MVGLTINLISRTHHLCERREYAFMILREYTIISPNCKCFLPIRVFSIVQLLISTFYFTLSLFVFLIVSKAQTNITKTIIVDQSGKGNFIHVQQAIDSIPPNNQEWTIIHLKSGVYK